MDDIEKRIKELEEENKMFRMILEALPINLFVKDTSCRYQLTSKICDIANGVARGGLKGKSDFELQNSKEIAQSFYNDDQMIMNSRKGSRMLSPTLCGETVKYYDIYKEPLVSEDGQVEGILGLVIAPAEMHTDEQACAVEDQVESYYGFECLMFDYDINKGNGTMLKQLENFGLNIGIEDNFEKSFIDSERIRDEAKSAVKKTFEKIKKSSTETMLILDVKDDYGIWHPALLNLVKIKNSKLNENRAIGILSYIREDEMKTEELMISVSAMKKKLAQITAEKYDAILYISKKNKMYFCGGKFTSKIGFQGNYEQLQKFVLEYFHVNDQEIYLSAINSTSEDNRDGHHLLFEMRILDDEGIYRWYEANLYFVDSVDGVSEDIIGTFYDMDEIVRLKRYHEIRNNNNRLIEVLSSVVESRDVESGNHIQRIKIMTKILLQEVMQKYPEYELTDEKIEIMSSAATMHDIGKIAIPDSILLKPGRLTQEEFEVMKEHTIRGCNIINSASVIQDEEYYKYCYDICRHHHEKYDGNGYPDKLKGDEISIVAQVVSIVDVYDALSSKRCYKDAYDDEKVFKMILNGECGLFNPKLIECLKNVRMQLKNLSV